MCVCQCVHVSAHHNLSKHEVPKVVLLKDYHMLLLYVFNRAWNMIHQIYQEEGWRGYFRGLSSTWAREIPGYYCFFLTYEAAKRWLAKPEEQSVESLGELYVNRSNGLFSVEAAIGAFIYCFELKTTVDVGTTAGTGTRDVKKQSSAVMVQYRSGTM